MPTRSDPSVRFVQFLRLAMAVAIIVALATQFVLGQDIETFRAVNFFSYFTVLSNVLAVLVLGHLWFAPDSSGKQGSRHGVERSPYIWE